MKHYADGKARINTERISQIEKENGINMTSPFGTNHAVLFEEKLKKMDLEQMNKMASSCGAMIKADEEEQKRLLRVAFRGWQTQNPPNHEQLKGRTQKLDMRCAADKKVAAILSDTQNKSVYEKEFPGHNPHSFKKILATYTLSDLQNLAARCGFNPSFDRTRVITLLVSEMEKDIKLRA